MIKKFNDFIKESYKKDNISFGAPPVDFGITHEDLDDIMFDITNEFPNIDYMVDNSLQSSITESNKNSFVITLFDRSSEFPLDLKVIHYVEPKIFELIEHINHMLSLYELEVFASDYGENDAYYQIIIVKKGTVLRYNHYRYEKDGTPRENKW